MSERWSEQVGNRVEALEAERRLIADATGYTREVAAGIAAATLAEHVRRVVEGHRDYINTIRLNVPERYREPQLDLCMVRMRDRIVELEGVLDTQRKAWEGVKKIELDGPLVDFAEKQIARIEVARRLA